jgi:DNA-binding response OmpR family regulator
MNFYSCMGALVVDWDAFCRTLTVETLRLIGFRSIRAVSTIHAAETLLDEKDFDVVLVDWEMDCSSLLTRLRSNATLQHALLVAMSFETNPRLRLDAVREGADAVICKPFSKGLLLRTMNNLFDGPAGRRAKIVRLPVAQRQPAASSLNLSRYTRPRGAD